MTLLYDRSGGKLVAAPGPRTRLAPPPAAAGGVAESFQFDEGGLVRRAVVAHAERQ